MTVSFESAVKVNEFQAFGEWYILCCMAFDENQLCESPAFEAIKMRWESTATLAISLASCIMSNSSGKSKPIGSDICCDFMSIMSPGQKWVYTYNRYLGGLGPNHRGTRRFEIVSMEIINDTNYYDIEVLDEDSTFNVGVDSSYKREGQVIRYWEGDSGLYSGFSEKSVPISFLRAPSVSLSSIFRKTKSLRISDTCIYDGLEQPCVYNISDKSSLYGSFNDIIELYTIGLVEENHYQWGGLHKISFEWKIKSKNDTEIHINNITKR